MAEQEPEPATRFEATIHPAEGAEQDLGRVADFDLDRVADPKGEVRVLVDLQEASRLVQQGFEVRLQRAVPVRPLDPRLVSDDDDVKAWLEERVRPTDQDEAT